MDLIKKIYVFTDLNLCSIYNFWEISIISAILSIGPARIFSPAAPFPKLSTSSANTIFSFLSLLNLIF
jgi:hypothetical protein